MSNPIVITNVSVTQAPTPNTLQKTGAILSQGGTTTAVGTRTLITQISDLAAILTAPLALSVLSWSGGVATATTAATTVASTGSSYTSLTGAVVLNLTASIGLAVGSSVVVASLTGTGADLATADGTFTAIVGTGGTTLNYTIATGLTISAITGGAVTIGHGITVADTFLTTIAGATPTAYNGIYLATAATATTFTYPLASDGGTSPATGTITYTTRNVAELVDNFTMFFDQGSQLACYVLELGASEPAAGVTELTTLIGASPQFFYAYLVPNSWNGLASFLTLASSYENTTSKTYFYVRTTSGTYTSYTPLMKSVFWMIQAPTAPTTENCVVAAFWNELNYAPSSVNKVSPFEYSYVYGVTPYPTVGNQTLLTTVKSAGGNYVGSGAEGGISNAIIIGGQFADSNPVNYWYSVDWAQINCDLAVSNAVINGSNNPINPLYYNQDGINRLSGVIASTLNNGVSYGLVLFNVKQTFLKQADFLQQYDAGAFVGYTVVNAEPFIPYSQENPSDYKIGRYGGFSVVYTPLRGFDQIIININVTQFVAG